MKIRKPCDLENLYGHTHPIRGESPEVLFMQAVCAGDADGAVALFRENKLFGGVKSAVDAPYGRFEGLEGIRQFAEGFVARFDAQAAHLVPVIQTTAGGRSVLEVVINFEVDGEINQVPMFIVGDFRTAELLDEVRLYCHFSFVPRLQAYRKPLFTPAHLEAGDYDLLTGAVREYYAGLHHCPSVDVDRIMNCMSEDCVFGGYARWENVGEAAKTPETVRKAYEFMKTYIPRCVGMRFETIIDNGVTCVIEWAHVCSRAGQEERNRVAMSGIAAYERNKDGLLCSIRISDYAGSEDTIEWEKTGTTKEEARKINFVEEFPDHIGCKSLTD